MRRSHHLNLPSPALPEPLILPTYGGSVRLPVLHCQSPSVGIFPFNGHLVSLLSNVEARTHPPTIDKPTPLGRQAGRQSGRQADNLLTRRQPQHLISRTSDQKGEVWNRLPATLFCPQLGSSQSHLLILLLHPPRRSQSSHHESHICRHVCIHVAILVVDGSRPRER